MIGLEDFEGMDKIELLMALEEMFPDSHFPETARREDLISLLNSRTAHGSDDKSDDYPGGVGVRNPRPQSPVSGRGAEAERDT